MKTIVKHTTLAAIVALGLTGAHPALGDAQAPTVPPHNEKTFKGTVTLVDLQERVIAVRGPLMPMSRTFNASADCRVALEDKPDGAFSDLHTGQRVAVHYYDAQGVRVARQIAQKNRTFKGRVTGVDPVQRTVTVKRGLATRGFVMSERGTVRVKDGESGSMDDLKLGDTVKVIYQSANEPLTAHRIEQALPTFTGTIQAIDARSRTVTVRTLRTEKKFHLAKGCPIVVKGRLNGSLGDLRIGDRMSVSYEDADGVLVANRIGREVPSSDEGRSQTAALANQAP